jgi:hypothetical protein
VESCETWPASPTAWTTSSRGRRVTRTVDLTGQLRSSLMRACASRPAVRRTGPVRPGGTGTGWWGNLAAAAPCSGVGSDLIRHSGATDHHRLHC